MDNQADQPFGGDTNSSGGTQRPGGGADPSGGGPQPGADQPGGGTPPPVGDQPWAGTPPPAGDQPWGGTPPLAGEQAGGGTPQAAPWGGTPQPGGEQPYGAAPQSGGPQPWQPPIIAGTGTGRPRVRPGRVWYLVAVALFLGGIAVVVFGLISVNNQVNSFPRVPLPAGGTITLSHSGGYVVYYEGAGASTGQIPNFTVHIAPTAPPAAVGSLRSYGSSVTYTFGSREGRAVLTLQIVRPGRFLVKPSGASAVPGSDLAFGSSLAGAIVAIVLPSLGLIFLGIAGAIVLFIIRLTRTRRARGQGFQGSA
jgi:hypothetical protein